VTQPSCANCGASLMGEDMYCGICGAPTGAAARNGVSVATAIDGPRSETGLRVGYGSAHHGQPLLAVPGHESSYPFPPAARRPEPAAFFRHATTQRSGPLSNATRYLCAAAYLDSAFTNRVLSELVASRRAVAPSLGIDLVPIVRHCLRARKAQLVRDVLLSVLLAGGLYAAAGPTVAVLLLMFLLRFLPGVQWERRSIGVRLLAASAAVVLLGMVVVLDVITGVLNRFSGTNPLYGPLAASDQTFFVGLAFLALAGAVLVGYSYTTYRTFSERLRPGAQAGRFERSEAGIEARIEEIAMAQWGNVTLYAGDNPFIGTGTLGEAWSIAIELDHAPEPTPWPRRKIQGYVPIDPVELHQAIRTRLLKLRDDELPENERISALSVYHHVVGDGHCRWDSSLIDPTRAMPYSEAAPSAIEAVIRHPAAGLRYYQRVCVSDEGQPVRAGERQVIEGIDQEVAVSAFVYAAVEGRMFYLEFVPATLPPIEQRYHLVDRLPRMTSGRFLAKVVLNAAITSFRDTSAAPFRIIGAVRRARAERRTFREEALSARDYVYADMGAQVSVREIRAATAPRTFLQRLDAAKYTKIIERLVTDTVFDFLVEKGVDVSAYRDSASAVINNGVMISGNNAGAVAMGHGQAEVGTQEKGRRARS
jgi:hypothetical protein